MEKQEHITYWLKSAKHDLKTADTLFKQKNYDWCLFIAHLVLEKTIKALLVKNSKENQIPPKTHNLLKLSELAKLDLSEDIKIDLLNFNDFNIEVRYPDYKLEFYKKCNKKFTEKKFKRIKEIYKCLLKQSQKN